MDTTKALIYLQDIVDLSYAKKDEGKYDEYWAYTVSAGTAAAMFEHLTGLKVTFVNRKVEIVKEDEV